MIAYQSSLLSHRASEDIRADASSFLLDTVCRLCAEEANARSNTRKSDASEALGLFAEFDTWETYSGQANIPVSCQRG